MNRRNFLAIAALGTAAAVTGCASTSPMSFAGDPLVSSLTSGISGLSTSQAASGVGSILGLAQSKLSPADFGTVAKTMPNADKYLTAAQDAGVATRDIKDITGLNSAFAKLGINPQQARGMLGGVTDWVAKSGGDAAKGMMTRALGL